MTASLLPLGASLCQQGMLSTATATATATFPPSHLGHSAARVLSHPLSIFLAWPSQLGSLPVCGDGAFRMWFLRKCLSVVGAGASQRLKAADGLRCQLRVRRASPPREGHMLQRAGGHPSTAILPSLLATGPCISGMLALSLLVLCQLMNQVSSHLDPSLA